MGAMDETTTKESKSDIAYCTKYVGKNGEPISVLGMGINSACL